MTELTRAMTLILIILSRKEAHGYLLMIEIKNLGFDVPAGTLYRSLAQMVMGGQIEERFVTHGDKRRRYYRITDAGRDAFRYEIERIESLVRIAK